MFLQSFYGQVDAFQYIHLYVVAVLCFSEPEQIVSEDEGAIINFTLTISTPLSMDINVTVITNNGTAIGWYA